MHTRPNFVASLAFAAAVAGLTALPAAAGDNDWVRVPTKTFSAGSVVVEDVIGGLVVDVKDSGPMTLEIRGVEWKVNKLSIRQDGGVLRIKGNGGNKKVWDWRNWFDFSFVGKDETRNLYVHLTVPRGMAINVEDLIGKANIGNTHGALVFENTGSADSTIGDVASARIELTGSGKVSVGNIDGDLHAETAGSGDIVVRNVGGKIKAEIAGSGSVAAGQIGRGLRVEIAGSGDFTAAGVTGPTHIEIAGSGSVNIASGEANPLRIEIMGSGDVSFGGTAVDPDIESMGSGNVTLKAYRGNLQTDGNVHLKTGK